MTKETDCQRIEEMLERLHIETWRSDEENDDRAPGDFAIEIPGQSSEHINAFGHCFVRFTFAADGTLKHMSFGY